MAPGCCPRAGSRQVAELEAWEDAGVVSKANGRPSRFTVVRQIVPVADLDTIPLDDSWRRCIQRLAARAS